MQLLEVRANFANRTGNNTTVREWIFPLFPESSVNKFVSMWKKLNKGKQEIINTYTYVYELFWYLRYCR